MKPLPFAMTFAGGIACGALVAYIGTGDKTAFAGPMAYFWWMVLIAALAQGWWNSRREKEASESTAFVEGWDSCRDAHHKAFVAVVGTSDPHEIRKMLNGLPLRQEPSLSDIAKKIGVEVTIRQD